MESLTDNLYRDDPQRDLRGNPGPQINDNHIRGGKDGDQIGSSCPERSKNRDPGNRETSRPPKTPQAETQTPVTKSNLGQFDSDPHRNAFPVNPETQVEPIVPPIQIRVRESLNRSQPFPQYPFNRRDIKDEVEIVPPGQRCGEKRIDHHK